MARIDSKICLFVFGLLQLHTVTGQTAATTTATVTAPATATAPVVVVPPGKEKTDQSTIVWAVSTDPLDPGLSGVGTGGQAPTDTSAVPAAATTQPAVAIVTTPAFIRQETTAKVVTPAPVLSTTRPAALTSAPPTRQPGAIVDPSVSPTMKADLTDTVLELLNQTGHYGKASDANVQEIVQILLNGSVPTDADLMRLGMVPHPVLTDLSTPPPYTFPGNQPPLDTSVIFPSNNQPTGTQIGPSGGSPAGNSGGSFPNPGFPMPSFPGSPPLGTPTGAQGQPQTGPGTGGTDPFGGALSNVNSNGMQNFLSMMGPPATSPKPALGDPFSMNTINGAPQLPNLGAIDPNALGPKPNMGPIGGLGTPGSTTDLLASLGPLPPGMGGLPPGMGGLSPGMGGLPSGMGGLPPGMGGLPPGMGGLPASPATGILDAPPPRRRAGGMDPMMMMMMMNPELMDQMMSGENPMLMMMMMQQMNRRNQRPRPLPTSGMGPLGGFPGGPAGRPKPTPTYVGCVGGLGMLPGQPGGSGGVLDMMNPMSAAGPSLMGGPGGAPMDLSALTGLGTGMGAGMGAGIGPTPGAPVNPMDLIQGSLTSSAGPGVPPTDLLPFPGMGAGLAGPIPSGAPITDPFAATVG